MTCSTSAVAVCCSKRLARLGDQPRVLHRDHRLRREVLQQRDLFVGERPDLLAIDRDRAEQRVVLAQRRRTAACGAAEFDAGRAAGSIAAPTIIVCSISVDVDKRSPADSLAQVAGRRESVPAGNRRMPTEHPCRATPWKRSPS